MFNSQYIRGGINMNINDILRSDGLFSGKDTVTSEPLNGGLSNETHLVSMDGKKYVVKINFPQNEYLGLSRKEELKAQKMASEIGIAPNVYGGTDSDAYSISEFINGHLMTREEVLEEENLIHIAALLIKAHSITGIKRTCSIFDLIDGYLSGIEKFKINLPDGFYEVRKEVLRIRERREKDTINNKKYCHNDIFTNNLLFDGSKITVIDWELSGIGDPYMDLATLAYSCGFTAENEKVILKGYFGYYDDEMLLNIRDLRYVGIVREVVWALFFEGLNLKSANHDMDYHAFACYSMDRLQKGFLSL
jgi:thiamine kinase-like enzyme